MKSEAVVKINKMGKAGWIIARIWFVCMCIGLVGCLIGAVATLIVPNDFMEVRMSGSAEMDFNIPESWDMGEINEADSAEYYKTHKVSVGDGNSSIQMTELSVDGRKVHMSGQAAPYSYGFKDMRIAMFAAAVVMLISGITASLACRLGKSVMDCETPFEENVIKNIQYVAYSLIPWCFVGSIGEAVKSIMVHRNTTYFGLDMSKAIFCFIILAVAYIFKYGAKLQQESDETL